MAELPDAALAPRASLLSGGHAAALVLVAVVFGGIFTILQARPWRTRAWICVFLASLVSTMLLMKSLASPPLSFKFPGYVTAVHFLTVWAVCVAYWCLRGCPGHLLPQSIGQPRRYVTFVVPIALSLPLSVVFNNLALQHLGAGLNGIIGTLAPVTTAVLSHALGRRISRDGWYGILVAGLGAVVLGLAEYVASQGSGSLFAGFCISVTSVLLRSSKVVLQDRLLAPHAYEEKADGGSVGSLSFMHVWALQAPPCLLVALLYAVSLESAGEAWAALTPDIMCVVLASCVSATALNLLGMFVIQELGASSMQIVGKLNTLIVCAFSVAFFGETLPPQVLAGAVIVLLGIGLFENAARKAHKVPALPTGGVSLSRSAARLGRGKEIDV